MKNHLLLIPALALCINASAQNAGGRISGIVVDEAEDTPLTGASIVVKELQKGQVADIDGKFTFTNLPEATYTVLVDLIGYDPQEKTVRVEKGRTTSLLICMKEQPLSLEQATVTAKSEARKVREQAMPVSVISMKQLQGTVSDIQGILAKTVGVTVRSTGGVGSGSRLSVRGLEGKRTVKKIEGVPYSDGHSVAIEYHDGVVYFSSFGVDKAGIFAYDPATGTVTQPVSLNGNVNYIHFFE